MSRYSSHRHTVNESKESTLPPYYQPCWQSAPIGEGSKEGAAVGLRVKRGSGGRVEGREGTWRWGKGSRKGSEVGSRVETEAGGCKVEGRGSGGRVDGQESQER
eukprot:711486-Rhodomonas_salina.6